MTLKLTPFRALVLGLVAKGEVRRQENFTSTYPSAWWAPAGVDRPAGLSLRSVNALDGSVSWLLRAGLVKRGERESNGHLMYSTWQLTDAGRAWLDQAAADGEG